MTTNKKSSSDYDIAVIVEGTCMYKYFYKREYLNAMNIALMDGKIFDIGARLSFLINYFRAGKWCVDCLKFTLTRDQSEIFKPKNESSFIYLLYLCSDCAEITKIKLNIN
uniref:Uncharacterized protein n=1 Tax=Meloidogyne enterolobii TaxID=390850 RepID=A0A6V7TWK8_MELEN|nr:unnamed protein product [Meloidogyne enterolobii]